MTTIRLAALTAALCSSAPLAGQQPSRAELAMPTESAPFRKVAEQFVAAAAAGKGETLVELLSPNIKERAGADAVRSTMEGQVLPFFADHAAIGNSTTVTNTTDASGNAGFAFYMWSVPKSGEKKPFVVYVVSENGKTVIANVLVNRFVEGRHQ
jgi:hypothetical protein